MTQDKGPVPFSESLRAHLAVRPLLPYNETRFRAQLAVMLQMQDSLNQLVFHDWRERRLAWHRAMYVEAAEFLGHLDTWKWWKKGTPDYPQANIELVDIWHFGLSWFIERFGQPTDSEALETAVTRRVREAAAKVAALSKSRDDISNEDRHEQVDHLVAKAGIRLFDTESFVRLVAYCGMDFDDLFHGYIAKNTLNRFRQLNGDKQGTYPRLWAGKEDNVHLDEIIQELSHLPPAELPDAVTSALAKRYAELFPK